MTCISHHFRRFLSFIDFFHPGAKALNNSGLFVLASYWCYCRQFTNVISVNTSSENCYAHCCRLHSADVVLWLNSTSQTLIGDSTAGRVGRILRIDIKKEWIKKGLFTRQENTNSQRFGKVLRWLLFVTLISGWTQQFVCPYIVSGLNVAAIKNTFFPVKALKKIKKNREILGKSNQPEISESELQLRVISLEISHFINKAIGRSVGRSVNPSGLPTQHNGVLSGSHVYGNGMVILARRKRSQTIWVKWFWVKMKSQAITNEIKKKASEWHFPVSLLFNTVESW